MTLKPDWRTLKPNWRTIVKKAWSLRLWGLAFAAQILAFVIDLASNGPFGFWLRVGLQVLAVCLSLGGIYARVVLQRSLDV